MTKTPQLGLPPLCLLTAASSALSWARLGSPPLGQRCHMVSRPHVPLSQCAALLISSHGLRPRKLGRCPHSSQALVLCSFGPVKKKYYFCFSFLVSTFPLSDPLQPDSQTFP